MTKKCPKTRQAGRALEGQVEYDEAIVIKIPRNHDHVAEASSLETQMLSTKQVLVILGLLTFAVLWRNIQLVPEAAVFEPLMHTSHLPPSLAISDTSLNNISDHDQKENLNVIPSTKLIHWTIFGLGHRLIRTTAAWHLAQRLGMTTFKFQWKTCGKDHTKGTSIFPYLFGSDEWVLPRNMTDYVTSTRPQSGKNVLVRNDVYGYLPAQTFQDHFLPLDEQTYKDPKGPFLSKIAFDVQLYRQLRDRYVFRDDVSQFMEQHRFADHTVIGIHLRAGNGEQRHFTDAGRQIVNETSFVLNLADIVQNFVQEYQKVRAANGSKSKPPLIFLATDTMYLAPTFTNATAAFGIPTVILPQIRVADNQGVTFSALDGAGEKCLLGWRAMTSDMILLSQSNILIAARHSSFTQSMPLSLLMDRMQHEKEPHFCEVSADATTMSCFQDLPTWLFRDNPTKSWTFWLPSAQRRDSEQVRHKALIHLPDIDVPKEYDHVVEFLKAPTSSADVPTHTYGQNKFNPKYRNRAPVEHPEWNFISNSSLPR